MAGSARNNLGLIEGFTAGEDGWDTADRANLRRLDSLVQLSVKDKDLNTPPGGPTDGDRYIVGPSPGAAWASKAAQIAVWNSVAGVWDFYVPKKGWVSWVEDEKRFYRYEAAWVYLARWYNALEYATIQLAIDAASAAGGGTVFIPKGTYTPSTTPSFSGITVPSFVHVLGENETTLVTTSASADIVTVTGSYVTLERLTIRGPASAGSGRGIVIWPTGVLQHTRILHCLIDDTPNWGIYIGRDDGGTNICVNVTIFATEVSGNRTTSVGSLYSGQGNTMLHAIHCHFNGLNSTGTYTKDGGGGDTMTMGAVHMKKNSVSFFTSCIWDINGAGTHLSMQGRMNSVRMSACYFEARPSGSRPYIITTSGAVVGFVMDSCYVRSVSTAVGLRLLETESSGTLQMAQIRSGQMTHRLHESVEVVLRNVTDELLVLGNDPIHEDTGAVQPLRVSLPNGGTLGVNQTGFTRLISGQRLRLPPITTTQRDALVDVLEGDLIYNKTTHTYQYRSDSGWTSL